MQGSIQKRVGKRGTTWTAVVDMPPDPATGRRRQKRLSAPTKREIERLVAEHVQAVERGSYADAGKLTVGEFIARWLGTLDHLSGGTRRRYRDLMRLHVLPQLGARPLAKLTPLDLEHLYADRRAAGLSGLTVGALHRALHRALQQAIAWDLLSRNIANRVQAPQRRLPEAPTWDAGQVARFLAAADLTEEAALWRVALSTGMRRGELLGLQWSDVDLARGVLHVRRARKRGDGSQWETGALKTPRSRRAIALPASTLSALKVHRKRQNAQRLLLGSAWHDEGYVFAGADGQPMTAATLRGLYQRAIKQAGLPYIKFHGLRHTNATVSLAAGEHPKIVQERLGHSSISMTLDTYSHVTETMQREAAARFDALLERAAQQDVDAPGAAREQA